MNRIIVAAMALTITALTISAANALSGPGVPAALQGEWLYGRISSIQYYNPTTGAWAQPSGAGDRFKLEPNGQYERSRLLQMTTYGCSSSLFIWEKGTVRVTDKQISFQPADGAVKSQACGPSNTYQKKGPNAVKPETWNYTLTRNEYGQDVLVLERLDGQGRAHYGRPNAQ